MRGGVAKRPCVCLNVQGTKRAPAAATGRYAAEEGKRLSVAQERPRQRQRPVDHDGLAEPGGDHVVGAPERRENAGVELVTYGAEPEVLADQRHAPPEDDPAGREQGDRLTEAKGQR